MRQHAVRPSFDGFFHVLRVFQIGTPALEPSISPQQLRMRGYCYCGDTYGRYGVKLPNRTAGLTGPDDFVMILVGWFGFGCDSDHRDAMLVLDETGFDFSQWLLV